MKTNQEQNTPQAALPMQVGTSPGEVQKLIEEIGDTSAPGEVEREGVLERDHDHDANQNEPPVPFISSS